MLVRNVFAKTALVGALLAFFCGSAYAQQFERRLAGIRIGDRGLAVLRAYGSPGAVEFIMSGGESNRPVPGLRIQPAAGTAGTETAAGTSPQVTTPTSPYSPYGPPGAPGAPGAPSGYGPYGPPGVPGNLQTSALNIVNRYLGAATGEQNPLGLPETTEVGVTDATGTYQGVYAEQLVNWVYRPKKFKNTLLEFRLDEDGYVTEICASSTTPSNFIRTSRGITFGDTYAKVLRLYGFPESHKTQGDFVTVSYRESRHVAFQFYKLKVVRIIVTAGD